MREQEPRNEFVPISEDDYADKLRAMEQYFSQIIDQGTTGIETLRTEIEAIQYWRDVRGHRITYYFNEATQEMKWEHHEKKIGFV